MDYSYLEPHDRQEGRPAPENGRGHPQNCEHQQYPTGHQVMSTGYPSSGYASYVHPIQAPITSANAGIPSQEGLHPPRMLAKGSTSSSSISSPGMPFRTESQLSTHLQQLLHSVALQPNLMQSDAVFHNLGRSAISQHDPSRTSSGHSSYTVSSSGQSLVAEVRLPNPRPRNPEANFQVNHPVVSQHVTTQNAETASTSSRPRAVSVPNRVSDVSFNQQECVNPRLVNRPLQENCTRPPVASSVSSGSSEMDSKSCQTEPLFDMLPVAARTLSSSFDLLEGFSYKMTGHEQSPGVVVTKDLQEGEEFGPFTGEFVDDDYGIIDPTSWEICVRGKPGLYISGTCDPNNWMTHVQVARCREEQNMEAFQ